MAEKIDAEFCWRCGTKRHKKNNACDECFAPMLDLRAWNDD